MNLGANVLGGLGLEKSDDTKPAISNWLRDLHDTHFSRSEMNKLVMDYLITEGFKEAAEKFRAEASTEPHSAFDSLDERLEIREAVQSGNIKVAMTLTNKLNPEILDSRPKLYFHLQQQHLIELIREKKIESALEFAQNAMAELSIENTKYLDELEKTMALLAYQNPGVSPFAELLNFSQRYKVASELNAAILEADHQQTNSKLENLLKMLLWVQSELDEKKVKYPKMVDVANGIVQD